jgi:hypothetical protein
MEMAHKDETEGRCPACRSPYDKERIVAMAANCRRLSYGWNFCFFISSNQFLGNTDMLALL